MRILVTLLLDTLPMLGNVLLLCFFVFFIFGKSRNRLQNVDLPSLGESLVGLVGSSRMRSSLDAS